MLKVPKHIGNRRHSCQLHDRAFVAPKCAGMAGADSEEKNRHRGKKKTHRPFRSFQVIRSSHGEFSSICCLSALNSGWSGLSRGTVSISLEPAGRSLMTSNVFAR